MTRSKFSLILAALVVLLVFAAPASAQISSNGFSFGTTFVVGKTVDPGGRVSFTLFGFFADGSGSALIGAICPIAGVVEQVCVAINVGDELSASSGTPPIPDSDDPTLYRLRSIQVGTPVVASLNSLGTTGDRLHSWGFGPRHQLGVLRSVVTA